MKQNYYPIDFEAQYQQTSQKMIQLAQKYRNQILLCHPRDPQYIQNQVLDINQAIQQQDLLFRKETIYSQFASNIDMTQKRKRVPQMCPECGDELKKFAQCQLCAQIYCQKCCSRKRVIPFLSKELRLCCEPCHFKFVKLLHNRHFYDQKQKLLNVISFIKNKTSKITQKLDKKKLLVDEYRNEKRNQKIKQKALEAKVVQQQKKTKQTQALWKQAIARKAQRIKQKEQLQMMMQQEKKLSQSRRLEEQRRKEEDKKLEQQRIREEERKKEQEKYKQERRQLQQKYKEERRQQQEKYKEERRKDQEKYKEERNKAKQKQKLEEQQKKKVQKIDGIGDQSDEESREKQQSKKQNKKVHFAKEDKQSQKSSQQGLRVSQDQRKQTTSNKSRGQNQKQKSSAALNKVQTTPKQNTDKDQLQTASRSRRGSDQPIINSMPSLLKRQISHAFPSKPEENYQQEPQIVDPLQRSLAKMFNKPKKDDDSKSIYSAYSKTSKSVLDMSVNQLLAVRIPQNNAPNRQSLRQSLNKQDRNSKIQDKTPQGIQERISRGNKEDVLSPLKGTRQEQSDIGIPSLGQEEIRFHRDSLLRNSTLVSSTNQQIHDMPESGPAQKCKCQIM